MSSAKPEYRLDGIYTQRQKDYYMQRVKLAAGVISAGQARVVAAVSKRFGRGTLHLTTRGSIEIHWLKEVDLPKIKRELTMAGLTSRGACGGAVRGITCASQGAAGFPSLENLARRLHRHFTGNPRFERLPKKFKIGIEAGLSGGKHLIQDVGLVLSGADNGRALYDVWIAGGLGREPRAAFKLAVNVAEERIIPIIEAVLQVYITHAPPPKRLKFLAKEFGEARLRQLIEAEASYSETLPVAGGLPENIVNTGDGQQQLELQVFAGELTAEQLVIIAQSADQNADGVLIVTPDQNISLLLPPGADVKATLSGLQRATGLAEESNQITLRVCPGNHECQMGLTATRDIARELLAEIGEEGKKLSWAISGCPNSCTQTQLSDVGILSSGLVRVGDDERTPRFDLYRRSGDGLGTAVGQSLTIDELFRAARAIG